jgi:hypothetical protein
MSDLPTYNVPAPAPSEEAIAESLSLQAARLRPVLQALAEEITGSLADQQKAIDRVTAALRRRIRSGLRGQVALLTPVMDAIHGQVAGSLAAQQVALATLMDQATGPIVTGTTLSGTATPMQQIIPPGGFPPGGFPTAPVAGAPTTTPTGMPAPGPGVPAALACPPNFANMAFPDGHTGCIPPSGIPAALAAGASFVPGSPVPPYLPGPEAGATPPEPLPGTFPLPSDGVPFTPPGGPSGDVPGDVGGGDFPSPAPPTKPPPAEPIPQLLPYLPDWCSLHVCDTLDTVTQQSTYQGLSTTLSQALQFKDPGGQAGATDVLGWMASSAAGAGVKAVAAILQPLLNWTDQTAKTLIVGPNCAPGQVANVWVTRAVAGFAEQWLNAGLGPLVTKLDYWLNSYCPSTLPSATWRTPSTWRSGGAGSAPTGPATNHSACCWSRPAPGRLSRKSTGFSLAGPRPRASCWSGCGAWASCASMTSSASGCSRPRYPRPRS